MNVFNFLVRIPDIPVFIRIASKGAVGYGKRT